VANFKNKLFFYSTEDQKKSHLVVQIIAPIIFLLILSAIVFLIVYGYRNPTSVVGQFLIKVSAVVSLQVQDYQILPKLMLLKPWPLCLGSIKQIVLFILIMFINLY